MSFRSGHVFDGIPEAGPGFDERVRELVSGGRPVAVAFSGGPDSTAALHWALGIFQRDLIFALHFNHGVRGELALRDAYHAQEHAARLGIVFRCGVRAASQRNDEASLRSARLDFFLKETKAAGACALIQGHHADDVAETLLMRIGRGSGTAGLAAPRPVSSLSDGLPILRPLLGLRKSEILFRLDNAGIPWVGDETNLDGDVATRNKVRLHVMKGWENAIPGDAVSGASRTRLLAEEDDDALNHWASNILNAIRDRQRPVRLETLENVPRAVIRRFLRLFLNRIAPDAEQDAHTFDRLLDAVAMRNEHSLSLGKNRTLRVRKNEMLVETDTGESRRFAQSVLPLPGSVFLPDGGIISASFSAPGIADNDTRVFISKPASAAFHCGPCEDGERYVPLGAPGSRKLREAMSDRKVAFETRSMLPVIREAGAVVWSPGLLPAESHRLNDTEKKALRLTWTPPGAA